MVRVRMPLRNGSALMKLFTVSLSIVISGFVSVLSAATASAATGGALYVSPASGSFAVGSTITMSLRESSNEPVNAVQFDLSYPASILEFVSIDDSQSAFGIAAPKDGGGGKVSVARGNIGDITGDNLVAFVNFKVIATGAAPVQILNSSQLVSSQTSGDIAGARNGANLTAVAANAGSAGGSSSGSGGATPAPSPTPTTPAPGGGSSVTIKSQSKSSSSNPTSANGTVELSGSTTIEATANDGKTVSKVEYLLGNRVLATITSPPYKYTLDASHLRNGTYTLTANTHYTDGTVSSNDTKVVVKNPWNATQIWLQLRHYAWLVLILVLIVADIIWVAYRRKRRQDGYAGKQDAYTVYGGDDGGTFTRQSEAAASAPHVSSRADLSRTAASLAASLDSPQNSTPTATPTAPSTSGSSPVSSSPAPIEPTPPVVPAAAKPEPLAEPLESPVVTAASPVPVPAPTATTEPEPAAAQPQPQTEPAVPAAAVAQDTTSFNGPLAVVTPSAEPAKPAAPNTGTTTPTPGSQA